MIEKQNQENPGSSPGFVRYHPPVAVGLLKNNDNNVTRVHTKAGQRCATAPCIENNTEEGQSGGQPPWTERVCGPGTACCPEHHLQTRPKPRVEPRSHLFRPISNQLCYTICAKPRQQRTTRQPQQRVPPMAFSDQAISKQYGYFYTFPSLLVITPPGTRLQVSTCVLSQIGVFPPLSVPLLPVGGCAKCTKSSLSYN